MREISFVTRHTFAKRRLLGTFQEILLKNVPSFLKTGTGAVLAQKNLEGFKTIAPNLPK